MTKHEAILILEREGGCAELDILNGQYNQNTVKFLKACKIAVETLKKEIEVTKNE